jgi:hypothetical protein
VGLVRADEARLALQADVEAEPRRQYVPEALPPARPVGLVHQLQETGDLDLGDSVRFEKFLHVRGLETDFRLLHAADGGGVDAEGGGRLGEGAAGGLPKVSQAQAEDHLTHGRCGAAVSQDASLPPDLLR